MRKGLVAATAMMAVVAFSTPALAAKIVLNNLGGVEVGSDAYRGFSVAAGFWGARLTNDVTINLDVGFQKLDPNILGQTGSNSAVVPVEIVMGQLQGLASGSQVDQIAAANLPGLRPGTVASEGWAGVDVITSGYRTPAQEGVDTNIQVFDNQISGNNAFLDANSANLKALGFTGFGDAADGSITFSNEFAFDFDPRDGISANTIDFASVAIHEIGHALGFVSGVDIYDLLGAPNGPLANDPDLGLLNLNDFAVASVLDLYRYSANPDGLGGGGPQLDWSVGTDAFFSIDGKTPYENGYFSTGAFNGDGWQASHWKDNLSGQPQLGTMDPTVAYGQMGRVTSLDLAAFDAMGWNIDYDVFGSDKAFSTRDIYFAAGVPEPATWAMLIAGFFMTGSMVRHRRLASPA